MYEKYFSVYTMCFFCILVILLELELAINAVNKIDLFSLLDISLIVY